MKIWKKDDTPLLDAIEKFTVGKDREFDLLLAKYDVQGSVAHATMLHQVGLLPDADFALIQTELACISKEISEGSFTLREDSEDIHSQIEWMLTDRIGDAGKKIHCGRSRNDQVAVDIKLFLKDTLKDIAQKAIQLFDLLLSLSEQHKATLMPGYTHMQVAMPSSFGLWFAAFAESLIDDLALLETAYDICNKNPLGSGAGYGSSFPLDRELTTSLLGFEQLHYNSIYAQMSRGKTERIVAYALSSIAATLSKLSMDICLYNGQNFAFITFPDQLTTGSSIMPHKKNPDVFELIRGKCNRIQAVPNELTLLLNNLPAGYHREVQLTKEILFPAMETLSTCLNMSMLMLQHIDIRQGILNDPVYQHIFTVEKINELVNEGLPFRDAYVAVGKEVQEGRFSYNAKALHHTHQGSIGRLCNEQLQQQMEPYRHNMHVAGSK